MRVSTDSDEYRHWGQRAKIYLDGAEVKDVIMADDVEGHIVAAKRDPDGKFEWDRQSEEIITQDLYGAVRIELFNA